MMNFFIGFLALIPAFAQAAYPSELQWAGCGNGLQCATLEFCQDGSNFGYRREGDTSACGSKPGPLIRMAPGSKYKLTLKSTAAVDVKTNIHTHGLHISGSGDADDVTRFVNGGSCLDYVYDIPSDHPGGTNWYHPHYHTETNAQTGGGAFGMIIIEDTSSQLNDWAKRANELVLQISDAGSLLANGNADEVLQVDADKWYRLRVSIVVPGARPSNLGFSGGCTVYKVASDGVWHSASFTTYSGSSFELTGASRADFAIKCSSSSSISWGQSTPVTLEIGSSGTGQSSTGNDANDLGSAPARPTSLSFTQAPCGQDCEFSISLSGAKINGANWNEDVPLSTIPYGEVHEWEISGSGAHPFHLHLYHMKIMTPGGCGAHQFGEFYDTISGPSCMVRFYAIDIGQRMILHCHVLSHEDNGAIQWIDVAGTPTANQNNVDSPQTTCSASAPTTSAPSEAPLSSPTTAAPSDSPGACLVSGACNRNSDCCTARCRRGQCTVFETDSPTPAPSKAPTTSAPTKAPTKSPTQSPTPAPSKAPVTSAPTTSCSTSTCSSNNDCCSNNCNTRNGRCKNRRLRVSAV